MHQTTIVKAKKRGKITGIGTKDLQEPATTVVNITMKRKTLGHWRRMHTNAYNGTKTTGASGISGLPEIVLMSVDYH